MLLQNQIPTLQIADLYGVDRQALCRRLLGIEQDGSKAHRDEQLVSPGDEEAVADRVGMLDFH